MIKKLVPGTQVKDVIDAAVDLIQQKQPELLPHFVKTCGFGVYQSPKKKLVSDISSLVTDNIFTDGLRIQGISTLDNK